MSGGRASYLKCPACGRAKGVERGHYVGFDAPDDYEVVRIDARECLTCHARWLRCGTVIERRAPRLSYKTDPTARAAVVAAVLAEAQALDERAVSLQEDAARARVIAGRIGGLP